MIGNCRTLPLVNTHRQIVTPRNKRESAAPAFFARYEPLQQNPDEFHRELFLASEFGTAGALPFFQAKIERNGDITYIGTEEGWLYLAVVVDLFSQRIVGWSLRSEMHTEIVTKALDGVVWA